MSKVYIGSYEFLIVQLVAIWSSRYDRSAMFATISSSGSILRLALIGRSSYYNSIGHMLGRAISKDGRRLMARSTVANHSSSWSEKGKAELREANRYV